MAVKIKLKEIAEIKGVSQRQLSPKSGIDIKSVQRIMRNSFTIVTTETLGKFAEILEIDASALLESDPPSHQAAREVFNSTTEIKFKEIADAISRSATRGVGDPCTICRATQVNCSPDRCA